MNDHDQPYDLARARVCVIVNGGSGRKAGPRIAQTLQDRLTGRVAELDIRRTEKGSDLTGIAKQAVEQGFDLIVAAGGMARRPPSPARSPGRMRRWW